VTGDGVTTVGETVIPDSIGIESQQFGAAWAQGAAGTTKQLGSQETTGSHETVASQQSGTTLQASRCSSRSIHRPAETGLKVTSVHIVATIASRTQYVNGLDMNQTP